MKKVNWKTDELNKLLDDFTKGQPEDKNLALAYMGVEPVDIAKFILGQLSSDDAKHIQNKCNLNPEFHERVLLVKKSMEKEGIVSVEQFEKRHNESHENRMTAIRKKLHRIEIRIIRKFLHKIIYLHGYL